MRFWHVLVVWHRCSMADSQSIRKLIRSHLCLREEIIACVFVENFGIPCSCQYVFEEHNVARAYLY